MITSKAQLMRELKNNKENVYFKTIRNDHKPNLIGMVRQFTESDSIQSNAFTLLTDLGHKVIHSWVYLNEIIIQNGIITFKHFEDIEISVYRGE